MLRQAAVSAATSQFLDAARWLAALAVVACHTCGLLLTNETQSVDPDLQLRLLFCLENAGHVAVVVFFVISGFLVGGQELLRLAEERRFHLSRYAIQRFSRIYTVLFPALVVTWLFDRIGLAQFNGSGLYTLSSTRHFISLYYSIALHDNLTAFIGNLFMLQTIKVPPFGSNGPLWSLAYEWWYYMLLMFGAAFWSQNRPAHWRFACLGVMLLLLAILPKWVTWWFTLWLLGVAVAMMDRHWRGLDFMPVVGLMLAGFALSLYGASWLPVLSNLPFDQHLALEWLTDLLTALVFSLALLSAKNATFITPRRLHAFLASFSYTLYLVHFPALMLAGAVLHDAFGVKLAQPPTPSRAALVVAMVVGLSVYGWLFASATERHTNVVRRALTALLPLSRAGFGLSFKKR